MTDRTDRLRELAPETIVAIVYMTPAGGTRTQKSECTAI